MDKSMFILISNIPTEYHTRDLRNFFSYSIEKEFYTCFNYRHRPHQSQKFNTAICKLKSFKYDEYLKLYSNKQWLNAEGKIHNLKCSIAKIKQNTEDDGQSPEGLLEFRNIPEWMPQGNVGTPTKTFIQYINQCIMPQSLIAKLGINLNHYRKCRNKVYTNVEHNYEAESDDELEDWERHESLHDDVTKQDRTSPYLFEDEIELKWEKGGSGLVFYTDENYWKDHENKDFDAETADDLDIDMSVYTESCGGDMDSRDLIDMRRQDMLRNGADSSLFEDETVLNNKKRLNPFNDPRDEEVNNGKFEKYTKGFGRKQMEKLGWKEGDTIGVRSGLKKALDASDGKHPLDKTGIGYHGEKVDKDQLIKAQKDARERERRNSSYYIGSKYDNQQTRQDTLLTRFDPVMKYRSDLNKTS